MQHPFQASDFFSELPLQAFDFLRLDAHGQSIRVNESELRHAIQ